MTNIPHEHDEDGNCIPPENGFYAQALPTWKFSFWDVAGVALSISGGMASVAGQGLAYLARECAAMANWKRQNYELALAQRQREAEVEAYEANQRQMAEYLRGIVDGPTEEDPS